MHGEMKDQVSIRGKTLHEIAPEQYGIIHNKRTRHVIFILRRLVEMEVEKHRDLYAYSTDYRKTIVTGLSVVHVV